jgi:hypothetical protein
MMIKMRDCYRYYERREQSQNTEREKFHSFVIKRISHPPPLPLCVCVVLETCLCM